MDELAATSLVDEASADPPKVFRECMRALDESATDDVASVLFRAMGLAARSVRPMAESVELLARSVDRARAAARDDLVVEALISLAGSQYLCGQASLALATLDDAAMGAGPAAVAVIDFQRGTIVAREGHPDRAVALLDRALAQFQRDETQQRYLAFALGNRGLANLDRGHAVAARADLELARDQFARLDLHFKVATMEHNLGRVAGRLGDVVTALERFGQSEAKLVQLGESTAEIQTNRLEVLLQAGLYREAEEVAEATERAMTAAQLELERAEAALALGLAQLGQGRFASAASNAARAAALFADQARPTWSLHANVVEMRSRLAANEHVDPEHAAGVAVRLRDAGQHLVAAQAWAVVAAAGDPARAVDGMRALAVSRGDATLELRLTNLEIVARDQLARADRAGAMRTTRAAIELGRRQQLSLGAADVRAGISAQLTSIAQLGLAIRRRSAGPWAIVRWVDQSRNSSLGAAAAAPENPIVAELVAKLRDVHLATRAAAPTEALPLLRQQARLQRQLAAAQRSLAHAGGHRQLPLPARLRDVASTATIVQHHRLRDVLGAVVIDRRGARLVELGPVADVDRAILLFRHALLRVLGGRDGAVADARRQADRIDGLVMPPIDGRPTVVIPIPQHAGLPWSSLTTLRDRPVTVAPTLRHWLDRGEAPQRSALGIVEGADVRSSRGEVAGIETAWSGTTGDVATASTVDTALEVFRRTTVAHVACHCVRREGDGRFAQLRLRDGDLTAFDLERLERSPPLVVLSACEGGLIDALPGEESTGLATAFFGRGTGTIIASTILLPDDEGTASLFVDVHAALAAGTTPSMALFEAQQRRADPAARLLAECVSCFGRG